MHLAAEPALSGKSILIVDKSLKNKNDRTWCFWEKDTGMFEEIVHHRWHQLNFFSRTVQRNIATSPYAYKMIRGIDFYAYCLEQLERYTNIDIHYEKVKGISSTASVAVLQLEGQEITCHHLFNSIVFHPPKPTAGKYVLLQHFKGWLIKTPSPVFDSSVATLMDFRTGQQHGTTFFYVMPTAPNEALVEYTLFTQALLPPDEYEQALRDYIKQQLQITDYKIEHAEFGVIPMTNIRFSEDMPHITHIGTAGDRVKSSSGYAFRSIQKHSAAIAAQLAGKNPKVSTGSKKFRFYDSVFLNVLHHHPDLGASIFSRIFRKNDHETIFRFLDNESGFGEDLQIISSLASVPFVQAGWQEIKKRLHRRRF